VLTVYITHKRLWDALTAIRAGGAAVVCGIEVRRSPEVAGRSSFKGGKYRVGGGEEMLLIAALDRLAALAGYRPVSGGVPWREPDDGPAPSYHGNPAGAG
jgi:hypothetical protein